MQAIIEFLSGKKSIGGTIILGVLGVLASAGVVSIDATWFQIVTLVVGVLTVASTIILLRLNIGGVVGSVVSLWALMFMLLYHYIVT